jgi:DNA helicase-2/ATP-dependent DNA helicase PcrA
MNPRETQKGAPDLFGDERPGEPSAAVADASPPPADLGSVAAILDGLDPEQLAAVTHADGPALVVAGAGTGKTRVITRRIAWLIASKRARPDEILALTFTEKAAAEMETRVDELVPYGFVGATIATFHAFCDRLVRQHALEIGLSSQVRVESDAEILVFLGEHLARLELARYEPLGRPDQHLRALVGLFDRARDEDVSPAEYQEFAQRLADAAGDDPERRDRAAAEVEKARAYGNYQRLLLEHGRLDFGAQISLALRLLREHAHVRRGLAESYRYILVDEFQDTNHVQFEVLKQITGARRNLMVVGDDDQSIYRFRGAKVENLLGFRDAFPDARLLLLRQNYRSGQAILDHAHRLIQENNPERLEVRIGISKRLHSARGVEGELLHRAYRRMTDEADDVAREIAESVGRGEHAPSDFAILARTHQFLEPFAAALRSHGVRFHRTNTRGLYQRPEIQLCLNVLRAVADPDDDTAVFHALSDPLFGPEPLDLARLAGNSRRRNRPLLRFASEAARDADDAMALMSAHAIRGFVEIHEHLVRLAAHRPTHEVLYEFLTRSGFLDGLVADGGPEATEQVQNLNKLFRIVQRIGPLLEADRVPSFIAHLDLLIEAGDDPSAAEIDDDENAVVLLTAHNAKGLEFPVVYLVQLAELRFPLRHRADLLEFPRELMKSHGDPSLDHYREERRLFYVAMTRSRDRLVLCHADDYGGKNTHTLSRFVVETLALSSPPREKKSLSAREAIERFAPAAEAPAPVLAPLEPDEILQLSNEQAQTFLTCPLQYYYRYGMQVPLAPDPTAMYGIAMHQAIREVARARMMGLPVREEDAIAALERAWRSEGFFSREHEERRLEAGRETLRQFIAREVRNPRLPAAVEQTFRFKIGSNVITGRFDRVDEGPDGPILVDYKTSAIEDQDQAQRRARESLQTEQLGLYALAYAETRERPPVRVELHFIESGLVGSAAVKVSHLHDARQRIRLAAEGIRRAEFPSRPDPWVCRSCAYSRFCPDSAARPA